MAPSRAHALTIPTDRPSDASRRAVTDVDVADGCCLSVLEAPLTEADATGLALGFAALSDPVRLRLLSLVASGEAVCSCDLEAPLGKSQPTISHHTKALVDAGLIVGEKRGRWVYWSVVPERLVALRHALAEPT